MGNTDRNHRGIMGGSALVPILRHFTTPIRSRLPQFVFSLGPGGRGRVRPESSIIINVLEDILRSNADFPEPGLGPGMPGGTKCSLNNAREPETRPE